MPPAHIPARNCIDYPFPLILLHLILSLCLVAYVFCVATSRLFSINCNYIRCAFFFVFSCEINTITTKRIIKCKTTKNEVVFFNLRKLKSKTRFFQKCIQIMIKIICNCEFFHMKSTHFLQHTHTFERYFQMR